MEKKVFVSFNFRDNEQAKNARQLFTDGSVKCTAVPVFVTRDVSAYGDAAIDREIRSVMDGCSALLVVVGSDSHNSPWVEREVKLADSRGMPIVLVRRSPGGPPASLARRGLPVHDWSPATVARELNAALQ